MGGIDRNRYGQFHTNGHIHNTNNMQWLLYDANNVRKFIKFALTKSECCHSHLPNFDSVLALWT